VAGAVVALALVVAIPVAVPLTVSADVQKSSGAVPKTVDTATIAHVLNRYGPVPGDIDWFAR
jgi:hypothetical protein